jgi:cytochrome c oxidase cbb3-type subunit 3
MSAYNQTYLLIAIAIVLVAVIWILSQVLITLSKSILKKRKSGTDFKPLIIILMCSVLSSAASAQDNYLVKGLDTKGKAGGMGSMDFFAISTVIGIELLIILYLSLMIRRSFRELSGEADAALAKAGEPSSLSTWWSKLDKQWMTRAVPIEKEADILLDHDYDGIKELDNALPPWWKYGFYITIVVAFVYIYAFHFSGDGKNPEQEYAAEMAEGMKQEELYKAKTKNLVDENNVVLSDALGIAEGKTLFTQSCIACHAADGGGGIGPNLTDEFWIHGGSMNNIYKTIKIGYAEKGMQSWESMYSPVQMKNLTSFVKSLKGTKPAVAKAPQGVIDETPVLPADSTVQMPKQ